jgi:hypothetical protein
VPTADAPATDRPAPTTDRADAAIRRDPDADQGRAAADIADRSMDMLQVGTATLAFVGAAIIALVR